MNQAAIPYTAIEEAFDMASASDSMGVEVYIERATGKMWMHCNVDGVLDEPEACPDDIDDEPKYVMAPSQHDVDLGKHLALRFARDHFTSEEDYHSAQQFFHHRGAYARFKDLLEARNLMQTWYDYEAAAKAEALRAWCADQDIALAD